MNKKILEALRSAVEYVNNNLIGNTYETDADYKYSVGYADGLSDAYEIIKRLELDDDEAEVLREVIDKEPEA